VIGPHSGSHAQVWTANGAPVELPTGGLEATYANAIDRSGSGHVVGSGFDSHSTPPVAGHALLWTGAAAVPVDLNPSGSNLSEARGVSGPVQVGFAYGSNFGARATMWLGSAASVIDLSGGRFVWSMANSASGNTQVGSGDGHALLWHGSASSVVDLHSTAYRETQANDVSGFTQVGEGAVSVASGVQQVLGTHALKWTGTASSIVDLNPSDAFVSAAYAVLGDTQVGYAGRFASTGYFQNAALWRGSSASYLDLHQYATGLALPTGQPVVQSVATGMDSTGTIIGYVIDINAHAFPAVWKPVP
jgi:hypothetical protein